MSPLDAILLCAILAVASWRLLAPDIGRAARRLVALGAVVLCGVQFAILGFTWQFAPGYLLLAATLAPQWKLGRAARLLGRTGLAGLTLLALAPWAMLPAPVLPAPGGPHVVGSTILRWTDPGRAEAATPDPADRREVIVQAWYPAAAGAGGGPPAYMDGLGRLPARVNGLPRFIFHRFDEADIPAVLGAPMAEGGRRPVVIFSPGYGAPRAFYTGLLTRLASRGYIVLAVDHPYEVAVTQLGDGRVVGPRRLTPRERADLVAYMDQQVLVRAGDIRFLLDQLARPGAVGPALEGRLDLGRIAAIGHSFGGATSVLAAQQDTRIRAAADIDGALYAGVRRRPLDVPFLLLESDHAAGHDAAYLSAVAELLSRLKAGGARYEIKGADHLAFTDAPLFFSPPGRLAISPIIGGRRAAADTHAAAADILAAFLSGPLKGAPGDVAAAAARYPDIVGAPIR